MRELISPEELDALFSSSSTPEMNARDRDDGIVIHHEDTDGPVLAATSDCGNLDTQTESNLLHDTVKIPECVISLYGTLSLGEILLRCHGMLKDRFPMEFFTFVQSRKNRTMVTVYAQQTGDNLTYRPPQIIELGPSRLSECLLVKQRVLTFIPDEEDFDETEKSSLIPADFQKGDITVLYWPVIFGDDIKSVLILGLKDRFQLSDAQNLFLSQLCRHLPIAVNNSDIHYNECRRSRQLEMLSEISGKAVIENEFKNFLSKVCESIRKSFNYHSVQIWIASGNRLDVIGHSSKCEMTRKLRETVSSIVQESWNQNRILSKNYSKSERSEGGEGIGKSCFAVPMLLQNEPIGVLFIESTFLDAFSSEDIGIHKGLASIIASRYASIRMVKDYQRSGEYLRTILESADDWAIIFTDNHGYILSCSVGVEKIFHISQKEAIGKDFLNMFGEEQFQRELLEFMKGDNGSRRFRNHKVAQESPEGTGYFGVSFQRVFGSDKRQIGFVGIVQNITDKVENESRLKQESLKDGLTGLYNQRGFARAINRNMKICKQLGCNLSLCFMDLDHLKQCNDTHGHLYGSRAIKESGEIMQKFVRPQDTCSRYGGDEFVIIMPQFSKQQALPVAEKIRETICEHFGEKITGSFGIADLSDSGMTLIELIAKADEALYRAKSLGRNRVVVAD